MKCKVVLDELERESKVKVQRKWKRRSQNWGLKDKKNSARAGQGGGENTTREPNAQSRKLIHSSNTA